MRKQEYIPETVSTVNSIKKALWWFRFASVFQVRLSLIANVRASLPFASFHGKMEKFLVEYFLTSTESLHAHSKTFTLSICRSRHLISGYYEMENFQPIAPRKSSACKLLALKLP